MKRRVAIALWCLATPTEYHTIGHLFVVARSTVCGIVHEVVDVIGNILLKQYSQFPAGEQLRKMNVVSAL